mgnify:FL=1
MNIHEIAEAAKNTNTYELAAKTVRNIALNDTEKETASYLDEWARKIGETGHDANHEIAAFVTRTVNQEFYDAPDELLDQMFERGNIGEFDDYEADIMPVKNTLVAYDAAAGGNVKKSYLDYSSLKPQWFSSQVETAISLRDLRRNGWKSVALLSEYAVKALQNKMFYDIFNRVDTAMTVGSPNVFNESAATPSQATVDAATLYLNDRDGGVMIGLSKYIQAMSKLQGYNSQEMLNEIHRTGRLGMIDGISLYPISSAKKQGNGNTLIMPNRVFGVAGKIGTLDMKGDVRTYETEEVNKEVIDLKVTGFTYGVSYNKDTLDNICKIILQ